MRDIREKNLNILRDQIWYKSQRYTRPLRNNSFLPVTYLYLFNDFHLWTASETYSYLYFHDLKLDVRMIIMRIFFYIIIWDNTDLNNVRLRTTIFQFFPSEYERRSTMFEWFVFINIVKIIIITIIIIY